MFEAIDDFGKSCTVDVKSILLSTFAQIFCAASLYSYYYWLSSQLIFFYNN
jgi:hypothetical protein